ncbi:MULTISPECIES: DUF2934 domain-containing protein [Paraburkholderia]|uniref:DUF2934 domain-containing protein n=1 Tax=Paraburkholderia TaxID=1822464 RepID=UPI0008A7441E|nr:DUF2934 domain-containing protein [Paraburkholderia hospita]SEI15308.1 Protein of unknown function [Paraburkholderia hospita]
MDTVSRAEKIRVRAYELWEKDGSLEGCADEYWQQARAQIDEEESAADGSGTDSTSRLTRSRKPDAE